jgi:hypothetical protein
MASNRSTTSAYGKLRRSDEGRGTTAISGTALPTASLSPWPYSVAPAALILVPSAAVSMSAANPSSRSPSGVR